MSTKASLGHYLLKLIYISPFIAELYAATSPETETLGGTFFVPWARPGRCTNEAAYDPEVAAKLWNWIEEETKGQF